MIESLEELSEELSDNSHGNLATEQWELLEHLKLVRDNFVLDIVSSTPRCPKCNSDKHYKYTLGNMVGWYRCDECKTEYKLN